MKTSKSLNLLRGLAFLAFIFISSFGLGQTTIFSDNFDNGPLNASFWTASPGPNNGLAAIVNSTSSCNGAFHFRLGKTSDLGGINTAYLDLALNLTAYVDSQIEFNFCTYDYFDETNAADGIFASNNGGTSFTKIIDFTPSNWVNTVWGARVAFRLDILLKNAFGSVPNNVILRFQQQGTGDYNTSGDEDGIAIDNVFVRTKRRVYPSSVPYYEDFESGIFDPEWLYSSREAAGTTGPANSLTRFPSNLFYNNNSWAVSGSHSLRMNKYRDEEGNNLNAADLYLNLGTYVDSQLALSFFTADFADETSIYDGVYASGDNGATFQKIIDYTPDDWVNSLYGRRVAWDLDELLRSNLNCGCVPNSLILRFQQYGDGDFNSSSIEDGIFIDDLRINTEREATYASLPFYEDFESGSFDPEWLPSSREAAGTTGPANTLTRFPANLFYNNNSWAVSGSHSLRMNKSRDDEGNNLNAADLHLKLGTYVDSQLAISFFTADFADETSIYDGIYASGDQGATFQKIIDYTPDDWVNSLYGRRVAWDLDELLRSNLNCGCVPDSLILRFQQYGNGDFNSSSIEDGIFIDDLRINTERGATYASLPFYEDFESGSFDPEWLPSSREAAGTTGPANTLTRFPANLFYNNNSWAVSGSHSLRMNKSRDDEGNNLNAADLHLSLGPYVDSQLAISFYTADFADETSIYDGIYASGDNGATFQKIIDYIPDDWTNSTYGIRVAWDLDAKLKSHLTCQCVPDSLILRFQQYGNGDFNSSSIEDGIFIDDLRINVDPLPQYATIPYTEDFESGVLEPEWKVSSAYALSQTAFSNTSTHLTRFYYNGPINGAFFAQAGSYGAALGKVSDNEGNNFNAFDLHLNLTGEDQVILKYWLKHYFEEYRADEGIYLSVNAGQNWVKIKDFDYPNLPNNVWREDSVDLSAVAAANNLSLSDSTILRFQQFGSGDYNTSGAEDGISLDNISVSCAAQIADFTFNVDCSTLTVDFTDNSQGTNSLTAYSWDLDGDGIIDTVSNGNLSYTYAGTGTYQVSLFVGNQAGCGDSVTKTIFIGSSVPAPSLTSSGSSNFICQGDTLQLEAQLGYQGYLWSTGETSNSINVTAGGVYSVRGLGIDGCFSSPTTIELAEAPSPLKPFISISGNTTFCQGEDSVTLIGPIGATNYLWSTGETSQTIVVKDSGRVSLRVVNQFGCASPAEDTLITVLPTPAKPVILQNSGNNTLQSSITAQTYQWFLNGDPLPPNSAIIDASQFGEGTYTLVVSNGTCDSEPSDPLLVSLTSIETKWKASLQIFPNPAQGQFKLQTSDAIILSISLYDLAGRQLDAQHLPQADGVKVRCSYQGLVIVKAQTDKGIWIGKLRLE